MDKFIEFLRNKKIHVVGVTGAEGSNILRFLIKHKLTGVTTHDCVKENQIEQSFKLWHKGISQTEKEKLFKGFLADLSQSHTSFGDKYLIGIDHADIVFTPQSWRLYKERNQKLWMAYKKGIPFYSITRMYLDYAKAQIIGVTGTVGKGSTAYILKQILENSGRKVYFTGNETWTLQMVDRIDEMSKDDILILEISHRQLLDGFSRAPNIVVFTNLFPNHLDELSWDKYKEIKTSLIKFQTKDDYSVINYDSSELRNISVRLRSKVLYFSAKSTHMNIKSIQYITTYLKSNKNMHITDNVLAAYSATSLFQDPKLLSTDFIPSLLFLPARMQLLSTKSSVNFYDDIKSTTPWSTMEALRKLGSNTVLICGGHTKGINYYDFIQFTEANTRKIILLKSELSTEVGKFFPNDKFQVYDCLKEAIFKAFKISGENENILVSPAAAFFYTDFIKGKDSIRKIITSLPPRELI